MNKGTAVLLGSVGVSLLVGFLAGGIYSTGKCPLTGIVFLKDRACQVESSCKKDSGCEKSTGCSKSEEAVEESATPAVEGSTQH